jgi:hypothetical protein
MGQAKRKAAVRQKIRNMTLNEHVEDVLGRVRKEFERKGEVRASFECVAENGELITIPFEWNNPQEKYASFGPLKDTFRRRGVRRYIFVNESWVSKNTDFKGPPCDDPNRTEAVMVSGVERSGPRKEFMAHINRQGSTVTLGPWEESPGDARGSWWGLELMEEGYSDRPKTAGSSLPETVQIGTKADLEDLLDKHPDAAKDLQSLVEVNERLWDLFCELQQGENDGDQFWAGFECITWIVIGALEDLNSDIAIKMKGVAQTLRDYPDRYPMFASVLYMQPSEQQRERYESALDKLLNEMLGQGHSKLAIFDAVLNVFIRLGVIALGGLRLAYSLDKLADPKERKKMIQMAQGDTSESTTYKVA